MRQIVKSQAVGQRSQSSARSLKRLAPLATLGVLGALSTIMGGCTWDSYMDPSVIGRWEHTPTTVPILNNIGAIEDPNNQWVEVSEITPEDLIPETDIYRVGPGDFLDLTIWDLITRGQAELLPRQIDQNGYVQIPQLGRIFVNGLTETEVADAIGVKMSALVADPLVSVVVQQRRQQVFHLMGNVTAPGPYSILNADFRILEALIAAGGFPEFTKDIYVIRQVPLEDDSNHIVPETPGDEDIFDDNPDANTPTDDGESLLDVIDDLSAPGMLSGSRSSTGLVPNQRRHASTGMHQPENDEPLIDLIEPTTTSNTPVDSAAQSAPSASPKWRFHDGRWVREASPIATRRHIEQSGSMSPRDSRGELFTQRKIRVPVAPLVAGDARYNIIIRPGDTIHVPPSPQGFYYIRGEIARPGVFNLPAVGKLTLLRAITAAGDLGPTAVPERVDLTRMVGTDEQATIMLNLRAIAEGTQPDIYIKPDDLINIGTKFWATPLAVLRGGLRTSYGFGFLLDRNFGNDVFGAPPTNINR
ncbi:MAG: polysaccharide biosynthesis/export family protein [Phycisphaerales bacterium]